MTLPQPYIKFNPPIKLKFCSTEEPQKIMGLWKYYDSYLVIHETGYTDLKHCTPEAVEVLKKRLNELNKIIF